MIEIKIDEKILVKEILNASKEILEREVKNEINDFNLWDNEELEKVIIEFYKKLIKEVLKENKDELKNEIKELIMETAKDVAFEALEGFLNKN